MMISLFPIILFAFLPCVLAASRPVAYAGPVHVPILRRSDVSDRVGNLPKVIEAVRHKYEFATTTISKRSGDARSGYIPLTGVVRCICIFPLQDGVRRLSGRLHGLFGCRKYRNAVRIRISLVDSLFVLTDVCVGPKIST